MRIRPDSYLTWRWQKGAREREGRQGEEAGAGGGGGAERVPYCRKAERGRGEVGEGREAGLRGERRVGKRACAGAGGGADRACDTSRAGVRCQRVRAISRRPTVRWREDAQEKRVRRGWRRRGWRRRGSPHRHLRWGWETISVYLQRRRRRRGGRRHVALRGSGTGCSRDDSTAAGQVRGLVRRHDGGRRAPALGLRFIDLALQSAGSEREGGRASGV